jgi:hypothetical protein
MSLLHRPQYEIGYSEEDDKEGLRKLLWSQFMCKCGRCSIKTGKNFMERLPVFILDEIAQEERMRFDIRLAYTCKHHSDKIALTSKNPHRVGLAVKIRIINSMKRLKLVRGLIMRGVTRIRLCDEFVYFDTDDLKPMSLHIK